MDQHRDYEGELREAGVRLTKPRKIILKKFSAKARIIPMRWRSSAAR